jgi:hypothetical protein
VEDLSFYVRIWKSQARRCALASLRLNFPTSTDQGITAVAKFEYPLSVLLRSTAVAT